MLTRAFLWIVALSVIAGVSLLIWRNQQALHGLEAEHSRLSEQLARAAETEATASPAPSKPLTTADHDALRNSAKKAAELRTAIAKLDAMLAGGNPISKTASPKTTQSAAPAPPVREWKNAGMLTPEASIETLIWSSSRGDVATLASLMKMAPVSRAKVEALFGEVSGEARKEFGNPDRLFATLIAAKLPTQLNGFDIMKTTETPDGAVLQVALRTPRGGSEERREILLNLSRSETGWQILVPERIVNEALQMVKGSPASAAK